MFKTFTLALACTAANAFTYRYAGNSWKSWWAEAKFERLFAELEADWEGIADYQYGWMDELFLQRSNKTTCNTDDELPDQTAETGERRKKVIHTKGVVGAISWDSHDNHNYTGLFNGADYGIVRLSDAGFMLDNFEDTEIFSPSAALKFIVDENKSFNMMTQVSFDGTSDPYFFAEDLSTHARRPENECMIATIENKFAEASHFPFATGTGHLASIDNEGNEIEVADQMFPYNVMLVPNREAFPDPGEKIDFLTYFEETMPYEFEEDGEMVPLPLFDVMAKFNPDDEYEEIGQILLHTELFRSTFGDERLFFQHETINRDLNKLKQQGEEGIARARAWKQMLETSTKPTGEDKWGSDSKPITALPDDNDEAMEIIEAGIREFGCPFAWLLQ